MCANVNVLDESDAVCFLDGKSDCKLPFLFYRGGCCGIVSVVNFIVNCKLSCSVSHPLLGEAYWQSTSSANFTIGCSWRRFECLCFIRALALDNVLIHLEAQGLGEIWWNARHCCCSPCLDLPGSVTPGCEYMYRCVYIDLVCEVSFVVLFLCRPSVSLPSALC